ncbi:hypothetical protein R6Q57_024073 [Mikania cordata]
MNTSQNERSEVGVQHYFFLRTKPLQHLRSWCWGQSGAVLDPGHGARQRQCCQYGQQMDRHRLFVLPPWSFP